MFYLSNVSVVYPVWYVDSPFDFYTLNQDYQITPFVWLTGTGGESIYGGKFAGKFTSYEILNIEK